MSSHLQSKGYLCKDNSFLMSETQYDIIVVGGGIVGLASAYKINCRYPDKKILVLEKEKEVVCDEIRSYLDNPGEQIFDDFEGIVFKKNPLGNPILGTEKSVKSFKQKDLIAFTRKFYIPSNMVLSIATSLNTEKVIRQLEHHFGNYRLAKVGERLKPFKGKI